MLSNLKSFRSNISSKYLSFSKVMRLLTWSSSASMFIFSSRALLEQNFKGNSILNTPSLSSKQFLILHSSERFFFSSVIHSSFKKKKKCLTYIIWQLNFVIEFLQCRLPIHIHVRVIGINY